MSHSFSGLVKRNPFKHCFKSLQFLPLMAANSMFIIYFSRSCQFLLQAYYDNFGNKFMPLSGGKEKNQEDQNFFPFFLDFQYPFVIQPLICINMISKHDIIFMPKKSKHSWLHWKFLHPINLLWTWIIVIEIYKMCKCTS